ncbi:AMP-binding protein [Pseudacidobacterium ailaaui]|jgi:long-chain acyl-CoA synthetase|uniref:AMP-binding protein n=1 Tax=Pseudacidobacterium ailaaui TaxID=1382359 RepID=UPI00047D1D12|nr:AMP-binding protein [Pseudacidobacterium ailaaui]
MRPHLATLVEDFERHSREIAIVTHRGNRRIVSTYGEVAALARRFAAMLLQREISAGDRVLLWGQNSAEWVATFFGCVLCGVIVVPLDAAGSAEFARRVLDDTRPKLVVGDAALLTQLPEGTVKINFDDWIAALPARPLTNVPALNLDTPLQVLFTSGTTSEPKGVVHTHRNVLASVAPIEREIQKYLKYERPFHPLRFLHTLPLSHVFGQFMGLWLPVLLGAEVHFEARLQAPRLVELVRRERISVIAAVPRVLELLRTYLFSLFPELPEQINRAQGKPAWKRWWRFRKVHHLLGWKCWAFVCGGAALSSELESFWNTLGFALVQGYGMTETTALITLNHPFKVGKGTIGKPLPGRDVRLSEDGEILVRGEMVSTAIWQRGQLTKSSDEWLATGDLACSDEEGRFQFLGRKGLMIVTSSGLNIHPEDVEVVLEKQSNVRAAVVVPTNTPAGTEAMAVLLFHGTEAEAAQAIRSANLQLADYQRIRYWRIWPGLDFPRTSTGKIQRGKVAQWASSLTMEKTMAGENDSDPLLALIAAITRSPAGKTTDEARLDEDLHLDSLGRVQLQSELEQKLGVTLDDTTIISIETLGELRRLLSRNSDALHPAVPESPAAVKPQSRPATSIYPQWPWSWPVHALRVIFLECVARPMTRFLAKPATVCVSRVIAAQRPLLIIANHVTAYDAALVLYALPGRLRRRVAIAMAADILEDFRHARGQDTRIQNVLAPIAYWLITALFNVFPLPRSAGFRDSFAHMGHALDRGYNVLIFPEGTRTSGNLQKFRPGIGMLVKESNAAVLPVALRGLGDLKQGGKGWFRSGKLELHVGKPMHFRSTDSPETITAALESTLRSMLQ